jgi:hypothetical protein
MQLVLQEQSLCKLCFPHWFWQEKLEGKIQKNEKSKNKNEFAFLKVASKVDSVSMLTNWAASYTFMFIKIMPIHAFLTVPIIFFTNLTILIIAF